MTTETKPTGQTVGVYFSADTLEAAKLYASRNSLKFSAFVDASVREELKRNGILVDEVGEKEALLRAVDDAFSLDELRDLVERRTRNELTR